MAKSPESTVRLTKKERMHSTVQVREREEMAPVLPAAMQASKATIQKTSRVLSTNPSTTKVLGSIAAVIQTSGGGADGGLSTISEAPKSVPTKIRKRRRITGKLEKASTLLLFDPSRTYQRVIVDGEPNTSGWTGTPPAPHSSTAMTSVVLFRESADIISNPSMGIQRETWKKDTDVLLNVKCDGRVWLLDTKEEIPTQSVYARFMWSEVQTGPNDWDIDLTLIDNLVYLACDNGRRASIRIMPLMVSSSAYDAIEARHPSLTESEVKELQKIPSWMSASDDVHPSVLLNSGVTLDIPKLTDRFRIRAVNLANEIAKRYEGSRALDYVDIGYVGNTGEWTELLEPSGSALVWKNGRLNYDSASSVNDAYPPSTGIVRPTIPSGETVLKQIARGVAGKFVKIQSVVQLKSYTYVLQPKGAVPGNADTSRFDARAGWRSDHWGNWGYSTKSTTVPPDLVQMRIDQTWIDSSNAEALADTGPIALEVADSIGKWATFEQSDPTVQPHAAAGLAKIAEMSVAKALLWRASYIFVKATNIPAEASPAFRVLLRHLGYRLYPEKIELRTRISLTRDDTLELRITLVNTGVARCPNRYYFGVRFRDRAGKVVGVWRSTATMWDVPPVSWPAFAPINGDVNDERALFADIIGKMQPGRHSKGFAVPYRDYIGTIGTYLVDIGVINEDGEAVVRLAIAGGVDKSINEWWYPVAEVKVHV